jgi:polysaccharide biosynthesis protein PslH
MRALVVTHRPPLAIIDGSTMAANSIITGLVDSGVAVEVLSAQTHRHPSDISQVTDLAEQVRYETWAVDTRVTPWGALRGLAQESYNVERFSSGAGRAVIARRLAATPVDVVILDSLFSTPLVPTIRQVAPRTPVILRAHNVEHHIWHGLATNSRRPRSWYLRHLADQLHRYEARLFASIDGIAAISPVDQAMIAALAPDTPIRLVEIGMAHHYRPVPLPVDAPLCSVASYDWTPNIEGMQWFLDRVWPEIHRQRPGARLHIAGRHSDSFAERFTRPGVQVLGPVPSAQEFLAHRGVVVAPILSGSGVRVKLVEAMLMAKPVVTTSQGGAGLFTDPDSPMRVRDDPSSFAQATIELLDDHARAAALGQAARSEADQRFSARTTTEALLEVVALATERRHALVPACPALGTADSRSNDFGSARSGRWKHRA